MAAFAISQVTSLLLNETLKGHTHNHSYSPVTVDLPIVSRTSEKMFPAFILFRGLLVTFEE